MLKVLIITVYVSISVFANGPVLKTGQTKSYNVAGSVVTDGSVKDDGYYQAGEVRSYSHPVQEVVKDNTTGLEWQDDYSDTGTVYKRTTWTEAFSYCSNLELNGGGWRLPNMVELASLVDVGNYNPSVTTGIFTNLRAAWYWSAIPVAKLSTYAWYTNFYYGNRSYDNKTATANFVCCVRGNPLEAPNFSRDNETKIVTDSSTGLQWQDDDIVISIERTWQEAIDYCENTLTLGEYDDWRLPNQNELLSIIDQSQYDPAMDTRYFLNTSSSDYSNWTSTTYAHDTSYAWSIYFNSGANYEYTKTSARYVRCIRGGDINPPTTFNPSVIMYLLNQLVTRSHRLLLRGNTFQKLVLEFELFSCLVDCSGIYIN